MSVIESFPTVKEILRRYKFMYILNTEIFKDRIIVTLWNGGSYFKVNYPSGSLDGS